MPNAVKHVVAIALLCCAGLCADSLDALKKAAEVHPSSAEAQNALGEALDEADKFGEARDLFERAVKLKPSFGEAFSNLGLACLQLNDWDNAAVNLDRAIALLGKSPEAGFAYYLRAKIYTRQADDSKALTALNRAAELRPDLAEAWSDLGVARKASLDDAGALAAFERAVQLKPEDAVAQYRLGAEYLREGNARSAVLHLQQAKERNPNDQSVLNSLQTALRKDGKADAADEIRQQLVKLLEARDQARENAVSAVRLNNEGANLERTGNLAEAAQRYAEALKLSPEHVGIRVNYAVALLRTGRWAEGLAQMREALRRDPQNQQIQAALKDALAQAPAGIDLQSSKTEP